LDEGFVFADLEEDEEAVADLDGVAFAEEVTIVFGTVDLQAVGRLEIFDEPI
jgi:hypothetical protein